MPTDNPRITFTLTEELREQVDIYKHKYRLKNQTQAVVNLIQKGFEALSAESCPVQMNNSSDGQPSLTSDPVEAELFGIYHRLNEYGKIALLGNARGLVAMPPMCQDGASNGGRMV